MKFIINHIHQNARTGLLKEIERLPGVLHETPMLFHYTKVCMHIFLSIVLIINFREQISVIR